MAFFCFIDSILLLLKINSLTLLKALGNKYGAKKKNSKNNVVLLIFLSTH